MFFRIHSSVYQKKLNFTTCILYLKIPVFGKGELRKQKAEPFTLRINNVSLKSQNHSYFCPLVLNPMNSSYWGTIP